MNSRLPGTETDIADQELLRRTTGRFREALIELPTFAQLADPTKIPERIRVALRDVDPDSPHPLNLFRVHWYNAEDRRGTQALPAHVILPEALTGVPSPIVVALGDRFPMIRAHKVLAAYACLAPRLVTGRFDPTRHRALWPSTGNYCRGGVAISRIMGCRGVAILPEGMSQERFRWLREWTVDASDVIRTYGVESNVKEIYDECARLRPDPTNVILNQFSELGNHLAHRSCTGQALSHIYETMRASQPDLHAAAFVSATGSAGTIGAGDLLKERYGTRIAAVEALECPTLLYNGFGDHNIQGIGDKHVPLIHNVMNTDLVVGVSDRATDSLNVLFNTGAGRRWLADERGLGPELIDSMRHFGLSSLCNVVASIKTAKALGLGKNDAIFTIATDGAEMYATEVEKTLAKNFPAGFGATAAARVYGQHLAGTSTAHVLELTRVDRRRIFNLGYFTWVEQQGIPLDAFEARRDPAFWSELETLLPKWDALIDAFNAETGVGA